MDKEIIEKLLVHDENAIPLLKKAYLPLILYILKSFQLSYEDQEECINDILLKIWNGIETYRYQLSFKNYIAMITRRMALNYVRKKKNFPLLYEDMDIFASYDDYRQIPWNHILRQLNNHERVLFYRRYYYFQSIKMISLELGMTYKAVESKLYRLRKKLQKLMKEVGYDGRL